MIHTKHPYPAGLRAMLAIAAATMAGLLVMMLVAAIDPAMAAQKRQVSTTAGFRMVTVAVNKSRRVSIDGDYGEIVVGNPEIADARPLTSDTIYLLGKSVGTTNLTIYDKNKYLIKVIDVEVAYDLRGLRSALRRTLGRNAIKVGSVNGRVILKGKARDTVMMSKAVAIAEQYAPGAVLNSLSVASAQQVLLEVRFVEAFRQAGRDLGLRWDVLGKRFGGIIGGSGATTAGSAVGAVAIGSSLASGAVPFGTMVGRLLNGGVKADSIIQALETRGLARRLAEPNLVALSGDTASFLAGGEFPFPVPSGDGNITIKFKKFGVGLAFTPTVLANGQINLKIEPEVSQLDPSNTLRINNIEIPGLIVRRAKTTIELRDGQSFAVAGLLQSNHSRVGRGLPWVNSVPVLGTLFSSRSYKKEQTDLVIIVTPRLVRPAKPGQHLATPLDNSVPTNDAEYFLTGRTDMNKKLIGFIESGGGAKGPYGHRLDF